ncbi:AAA family ATPase [Actinobacillus equuli subsp. haemolyticus]|uniref:ParA family protein n=1 Tax=Actinobacillus equuli TaxID=718 RepID=UPI00244298F5|nr:AAA family ATPase [Actinobacillus equuli]WGE70720.1 AAA family ATPase [Actinobacillus equuli subsp. haemolyticus]
MPTAKIISFINMKGGVGKTTLCIGLADYLSNFMNKRVLVLDVDPQFNTTQSFLSKYDLTERYLNELKNNSVRKIFQRPDDIHSQSSVPTTEIIYPLTEFLGIIWGDINLIFDNNTNDIAKVKRIKKFIDENELRSKYDYIFIDCPPTISMYTDSALIVSDYFIAPVKVDQYSTLGVTSLLSVVNNLKYEEDLKIQPLGVVYTHIENTLTQKTRNLKETLENTEKIKELYFFRNHLSYVRDLMVGQQGNIASHYQRSQEDIKAVAEELIERISSLEEQENE